MVSVGVVDEPINQAYDVISTGALIINLVAAIMNTYDSLTIKFGGTFAMIEKITVAFFAIDFILRMFTATELYPGVKTAKAVGKYVFSFAGIVDWLSFLPYYLPVFFPSGAAVFRMFRVVRILRLFRINAYYDSLNVITEVLSSKKQQLMSSVFIIVILMVASSLCMYSVEHAAQPDVFQNAFSGIWWAASTLLTVGYGDIYPVTTLGKFFGILIAFLGVGMVAIPTGIISAGFVEQYTRLKELGDLAAEHSINFIEILLDKKDKWVGVCIKEVNLPDNTIVALIKRGEEVLMPNGDTTLLAGDVVVLGSDIIDGAASLKLSEVNIGNEHPWKNQAIKDLDISRKMLIVVVKRKGKTLVPDGETVLKNGDVVVISDFRKR
ncbi:MAG: potassium channel protein [Lachnospiraceae bacterium]|jgi:voltage-gated potassium channel|nr:potassium channel protein [Lachnospiraceae bacterium]